MFSYKELSGSLCVSVCLSLSFSLSFSLSHTHTHTEYGPCPRIIYECTRQGETYKIRQCKTLIKRHITDSTLNMGALRTCVLWFCRRVLFTVHCWVSERPA